MTTPDDTPTAEQPTVTPTVSTAPARSRWHWSALPDHLGRARTSTVVLCTLFVVIGALYLSIRPDPGRPVTTPAGNTGGVVEQTTPQTTTAPTTGPETTTAPETTTEEVPTTTAPTETTVPEEPTETLPTDATDTAEQTPTLPTLTPSTEPNTSGSSPTP
jgi:hypothetical protein